MLWALSQLGYNGSKIVSALKEQAYNLGLVTILRVLCCGVTAFLLKPKYEDVWASGLRSTQEVEGAGEPLGVSWTNWRRPEEATEL